MAAISFLTLIYTWGAAHERNIVKDNNVADKVQRLVATDSIRMVQMTFFQDAVMDSISHISHQLRGQKAEFQKTKSSLDNLRVYMINNAATKEDMVEVLSIWDEKKNLNFGGIVQR